MLGKLILVSALLALGPARSYSAGRFAMTIDGEAAGFIKSVSGGPLKGEVSTHNLGPENVQKKHLATIKHEEITVEVGLGMSEQFSEWIRDSFNQKSTPKDLEVTARNFDIKLRQAKVNSLTVPTLDAKNKTKPLTLKVGFVGGQSTLKQRRHKIRKPAGEPLPDPSISSFGFLVDGTPCRATKVDSFTLKQEIIKKKGAVKPQKIKIYVDSRCASRLGGSAKEKHGASRSAHLSFYLQNKPTEFARIDFGGVSVAAMQSSTQEGGPARFEVELYVESIHLDL